MARFSDRLTRDLSSNAIPDHEVKLHLLLRRGLDAARYESLIAEITRLVNASSVEFLERFGIVLIKAPLKAASHLADVDGIEWIDLESDVPPDSVFD